MIENRILYIEDDEDTSELLTNFLEDCGFCVTSVFTATDGMSKIKHEEYHLVLLDLNLPDYSGFEVLKSMSSSKSPPIIILSAYGDIEHKLQAFKFGACDYLIKPFDLKELEARMWVHLKRNFTMKQIDRKQLFYVEGASIYFKGEILNLTKKEFMILSFLIQKKNQVVKREEFLLDSQRSLDNHIKNIRDKIGDSHKRSKYLRTIYSVGYRLNFY